MIWLDTVLSTPVIGVTFTPNFPAVFKYREIIISHLKNKENKYDFSIALSNDNPINAQYERNDGFVVEVKDNGLVVGFKYQVKQKKNAGKLPSLEVDDIKIYSEILNEEIRIVVDLIEVLNKIDSIEMKRVGVMSNSNIEVSALPPGIQQFLEFLGRPWELGLEGVEGNITALIAESDSEIERCHHIFKLAGKGSLLPVEELEIKLDYQLVFKDEFTLARHPFEKMLNGVVEKAVAYFDRFGTGDLSYD